MCGITGIYAFNEKGENRFPYLDSAVDVLSRRGPDGRGTYHHGNIALGHRRLAIIDTSEAANQPMTDTTGRYTIVFNGEIYNFRELKKELSGLEFKTSCDTEVLLNSYIKYGKDCLDKLNGFFAFAIYDKEEQLLFLARDRMGIKPLLYFQDAGQLIFASEMKSLLAFDIPRKLDKTSLFQYLQFNYIAAPHSIFENVKKLEAGHYMEIKNGQVKKERYYQIPQPPGKYEAKTYEQSQKELYDLLDESVHRRLVADVPLGAFLSGGIDSSVIVALASKHTAHLNTFSIGYKDEPLFDETKYANMVAEKFKTNHTVFSLSNDDLFAHLHKVLDYIDEPFADSSALAVHILSAETRKHVTVSLSGDGADELFSGYNKHAAEFRARKSGVAEQLVKAGSPIWNALPKSRNSKLGNLTRQLARFSEGMNLSARERYWKWAAFMDESEARQLFSGNQKAEFQSRKKEILKYIDKIDFNTVLYTDLHLVLQNDMLTKVDSMSMANSLEIRVPFLDHQVVNFVSQLPVQYKINHKIRKRILQDTFRNILPQELYQRPKHGFEVPLLKWFRTELKSMITDDLLEDGFVREQGIFEPSGVQQLKNKLFSGNPGDSATHIWNLVVFQYWYKKHLKA